MSLWGPKPVSPHDWARLRSAPLIVDRLASVAFEEYGVLVVLGRMFGAPDHFRLCFGTDTDTVTAGLEGLSLARET